jgi:ABC-type molybdate transport system substrate-binding protein
VLTDAPNPQAAQAFLDFVRSGQALKVFTDAGFGTP